MITHLLSSLPAFPPGPPHVSGAQAAILFYAILLGYAASGRGIRASHFLQ
jgi:hypothetical protein